MADTTIGQAIALGNIARPDTEKVFTKAVMRGQEMDLRKQKFKQEEAKAQKQLQSEFAKMLNLGKGGFLPIYQEQASDIISGAYSQMYKKQKEGDLIGAASIQQDAQRRLEDLKAENDEFKAWQGTARQGGLITQDVLKITGMPFSQATQEYNKRVATNPEIKEILMFDEQNRRFVPRPVKEVNYNPILNSTVSNLLQNASKSVFSKEGNFIRTEYNVSDDVIASRANELSADNDLKSNIILLRPQDFRQEFDNIVKAQNVDVNVPEQRELARRQAVKNVIEKDLKTNIDKVRFANAPRQGGKVGYDIPTPLEGGGGDTKTIVKRKVLSGYEDGDPSKQPIYKYVESVVKGGDRYSFKSVEVLAGRGDSFLNLETGERMTGNTIQSSKVGNIKAFPIATEDVVQDFKGKKRVVVKAGELITEDYEGLAKNQGKIKYIPRWEAITKVKTELGTKEVSTLIDFEEGYGAVLGGQSKDDIELTNFQIKAAQEDANKLNAALRKAPAKAATEEPKKGLIGKKAGEGFDAWKKRTKKTSYTEYLKS